MSRTYLEAIFRHKFLLGLPLIICFTLAFLGASQLPRPYTVSGSFWVDAQVPAYSTNGDNESSPASGESTWLFQLLHTREFMREVIQDTPMAADFARSDELDGELLLMSVASTVSVVSGGPQLVNLYVTRGDPDEAIQLANSVLKHFAAIKVSERIERASANVEFNKKVLDASRKNKATTERRLDQANDAYDESVMALTMAKNDRGLDVVDEPTVAVPEGRKKTIVMASMGGVLAGVTVSFTLLLLLLARDTSVRNEEEAAAAFGLPVVGSAPDAPAAGSRGWIPSNLLQQRPDAIDQRLVPH